MVRTRSLMGLVALLCGCAAAPPTPPEPAAMVVGRLLVYRDGRPLTLLGSGSPLTSSLHPAGALTAVRVHNLDSRARFTVAVDDEHGWFAARLPAGAYALALDHFIWRLDTPARFQVAGTGQRCYLGTLGVDLFRHASARGESARRRGGEVPAAAHAFQVLDQLGAAQRHAGVAMTRCPLRLVAPPAGTAGVTRSGAAGLR